MTIETIHWHTLHPRYLKADARVLDLGANVGLFSRKIVERFGCHTVAVEPSPDVFKCIPEGGNIRKYRLAITTENADLSFHVAENPLASRLSAVGAASSSATSSHTTVPGQRLEDLVSELGWDHIDLLKMDIEGAEIEVLNQASETFLSKIGQMTIEFHDFCKRTSTADVENCLTRLADLGFRYVRMSRVGHQDTWLININHYPISQLEYRYIKYFVRNWAGLKRVCSRGAKRVGLAK